MPHSAVAALWLTGAGYAAPVSSPSQRWATFDIYGTLVDWNAGIGAELARLLGDADVDGRLELYHDTERRIQREQPTARYREVMALALAEVASRAEVELPAKERDALGRSLPDWPVFPEVGDALTEAHERGWTLVALSNTDRDLIDASLREIGVPFDRAIVASEVGSYKPALGHWHAFYQSTGADRDRHVHVAQSHFHDIAPADQLGIPSIWINRLGEQREPPPTRELSNLSGLANTLDELVPPAY